MRSPGGPSRFAVARAPFLWGRRKARGLARAVQMLRGGTDLTRPHGGAWYRSVNLSAAANGLRSDVLSLVAGGSCTHGHERGKGDGPWIATHSEARDCRVCLTLVIGLITCQRQRRTIVVISARSESHAEALGKIASLSSVPPTCQSKSRNSSDDETSSETLELSCSTSGQC